MHTPKLWHLTSQEIQSSVPANDHYGTPQVDYHEDNPSDGFLNSSKNGTTEELCDNIDAKSSDDEELPKLIERIRTKKVRFLD